MTSPSRFLKQERMFPHLIFSVQFLAPSSKGCGKGKFFTDIFLSTLGGVYPQVSGPRSYPGVSPSPVTGPVQKSYPRSCRGGRGRGRVGVPSWPGSIPSPRGKESKCLLRSRQYASCSHTGGLSKRGYKRRFYSHKQMTKTQI